MSAGSRLGFLLLLLCHCSVESMSYLPDAGAVVQDAALSDGSIRADMSIDVDMSVPLKPSARIVAKKLYGEDGSLFDVPDSFYDTKLGVPCSFLRDPNGTMRCLPQDPLDSGLSILFIDPSCTTPIAAAATLPLCGAHTYRYVLHNIGPTACSPTTWTPYIVGLPVTPMAIYNGTSPGTCRSGGTTAIYFYALTPAQLTDFVAAVLK